jgi:hypothetical protein
MMGTEVRMFRLILGAAALLLPSWASAQAFRCTDVASGRTLYTDQPCAGGYAVVPALTPEEIRADAERADARRARELQREELVLERDRIRLEQDRERAQARPASVPSESRECSEARKEAAFRAGTAGASDEQIRTARANAALACGQPAPEEIVVVQPPPYARPYPRRDWHRDRTRPSTGFVPDNSLVVAPYPLNVAPYPLR